MKNVIHCFFLFNGFLQTIPSISTNSPLASFVPVLWTMSMGMLFELIADIRRWNSDKKVNNYKVELVYESSGKVEVKTSAAEKLKVGDIIKMNNGCMVPADCVVLSTNDPLGQCYISTANLDGERNLKPKLSPGLT